MFIKGWIGDLCQLPGVDLLDVSRGVFSSAWQRCFWWKSIKMNCHKLVNFEEFLSPGEHSGVQVSWTYVSTIHGHKMSVAGGTSASLQMSSWPYVVLLLTTRWLYWGYIWLPTASSSACFRMSQWPYVVLLMANRCVYWGYICIYSIALPQNVKQTLCMTKCQADLM